MMKKRSVKLLVMVLLTMNAASAVAQASASRGCTIAGSAKSALTIEEYADFECPYCARGASTMKRLLRDYPGQIRLIYRNLPLGIHPNALISAKAMTAVCMQSGWQAHAFQNELFTRQSELSKGGESFLFQVASQLGVNTAKMKLDMEGAEVAKIIAADLQSAHDHSFTGTPSFLIGTESIVGAYPYADVKKMIDRQLGH